VVSKKNLIEGLYYIQHRSTSFVNYMSSRYQSSEGNSNSVINLKSVINIFLTLLDFLTKYKKVNHLLIHINFCGEGFLNHYILIEGTFEIACIITIV